MQFQLVSASKIVSDCSKFNWILIFSLGARLFCFKKIFIDILVNGIELLKS